MVPVSLVRVRAVLGAAMLSGLLAPAFATIVSPVPVEAQTLPQSSAQGPVVVRGNRRIETETILAYMDLRRDQEVTAEDLNRAVRRLFDTGLFRDVQIIPGDRQMIVEVIENPSINEIAFEGNDALNDEALQQIISLRPRLPFTVSAAEADAQAIISVYRRTGRYGAEVEPVIIERPDNRLDLIFEIVEGDLTGVSSIDFVGNRAFSDRRLRGVIETSESGFLSQFLSSDVYDPDRLELDKELLRQFYFERGHAVERPFAGPGSHSQAFVDQVKVFREVLPQVRVLPGVEVASPVDGQVHAQRIGPAELLPDRREHSDVGAVFDHLPKPPRRCAAPILVHDA